MNYEFPSVFFDAHEFLLLLMSLKISNQRDSRVLIGGLGQVGNVYSVST